MRDYDVVSDGLTVWVNAASGECLGRFGKFGIDVHKKVEDQRDGASECLFCTHGPTTLADWEAFRVSMALHHRVQVGDTHRPSRLQ